MSQTFPDVTRDLSSRDYYSVLPTSSAGRPCTASLLTFRPMSSLLGSLWTGRSFSVQLTDELPKLDGHKELDLSQKCELRIDGMTCGSCVEVCFVLDSTK